MFSKIYDKIKIFLKNNYDTIIFLIIASFLVFYKFPYVINKPGGVIDTKDKVEIASNVELKGSLNLAYVSEIPANSIFMLLSFINKDWDREKIDESVYSLKEANEFEHLMLNEANNAAIICALKASNIEYAKKDLKTYVTYVYPSSKTNLEVGDEIVKINGIKITNKKSPSEIIANKKIGDDLKITVLKNGKKGEKTAELIEINGEAKIGISYYESYKIDTDEKIEFNFKNRESGASGGLMMALTIYSYLNDEDITKGRKIVGTGTILSDGTVGEIGGVKYKLLGAVSEGADIFLVPKGDNYKEAIKIKKERNLKIKIKGVSNFDEALEYLRSDYE